MFKLRPDRTDGVRSMNQENHKKAFRNALGRFVTGVTVITTRDGQGRLHGLTANSFNSVSLDPPMVVWSLSRNAPSLPAFEGSDHYAINILGADQMELSQRFATPLEDKFEGVTWRAGLGGAPVLAGCLAHFECRNLRCHDGGDHLLFLGGVDAYEERDGEPLLFVGGRYGVAAAHPEMRVS